MEQSLSDAFVLLAVASFGLMLIGWYTLLHQSAHCAGLECVKKYLLPWAPLVYKHPLGKASDVGLGAYLLGAAGLTFAICAIVVIPLIVEVINILGSRDFAIFVTTAVFLTIVGLFAFLFPRRMPI